jgi:hypothetical protein
MIGTINERNGSESSKCPPSRSQVSANHSPPAKIQRLSHGYTETRATIKELEGQIRNMRI